MARGAAARSADARLALWRDIAAQGWPALLAPAASDGLGLGLREAWIVAEAAGRHLVSLPLVANMVVLPTLCEAGLDGAPAHWARVMMEGEAYFADAALRPDGSAFFEGAGDGVPALAVRNIGPQALRLERYAPAAGVAGLDPTMPVAEVTRPELLDRIDVPVGAGAWRRLRTRLCLCLLYTSPSPRD